MYLPLKYLHLCCVAVSIALFLLRGALTLAHVPWRTSRLLRIAPHVIDTILLASGLALATVIGQYPFVAGWLTAKVVGLLVYVVLGSLALRYARTPALRAAALGAALVAVGYIVATALHHDWDPARW
jgi:uncharacterized membrane protein SirB2